MTVAMERTGARRIVPMLAWLGLALGAAGALALLLSGPGTRWGWWDFRTGFRVLAWGAYGGAAGVVIGLSALVAGRVLGVRLPTWIAAAGVLLGLVAVAIPLRLVQAARAAPRIHDVTTDTERPPEFVALAAARAASPNGAAYGGPAVAAQQRAAYPDIQPLRLAVPPGRALDAAAAVARETGWTIAAVDPSAGRLEATARTRWFGFKDDVVVRVVPDGSGARLDVRSASRVGLSDLGTNARRVREFTERVRRLP